MPGNSLETILAGNSLYLADVGASYFIPDTWNYLTKPATTRFVLFDPVGENLTYASKYPPHKFTIIPKALAQEDGVRELFLANTKSVSSILEPQPEPDWSPFKSQRDQYFFPLKIVDVEVRSFASCLKEYQIEAVHAIKLDTQGSELEIIKGLSSDQLSQVLMVEMEISMEHRPFYRGAPKLAEVINFFEAAGFQYINTRISRLPLEMCGFVGPRFAATVAKQIECDALFVRDILATAHEDEEEFIASLRRLVVLLSAYYLHGEAVTLLRAAATIYPKKWDIFDELEIEVGNFAKYQRERLDLGDLSLWHRDMT